MSESPMGASGTGVIARLVSLWSMVGASFSDIDWQRLAAMTAFLYSAILLGEWWWKRIGRPFAEHHGWVERRYRRRNDKRLIK